MPLQAERLPPEIWLYIFTFIEGHDLVRTFSHLNSFFDSLLRSPHLQLSIRIKRNESNQRLPESAWSCIIIRNIYALSVGLRKANCLVQFLRWHARYLTRLRALTIYLRQSTLFYKIRLTFALQQLPSLNCIRIKYQGLRTCSFNLDPILMYIFQEKSTINRCFFDFYWLNCDVKTSKLMSNPNLKYLHITEILWNNLFGILSFTPRLYQLKTTIDDSSHIVSHADFTLSQLRKLDLIIYNSSFTPLRKLKQAASCLQYLRLKGYFEAENGHYFNEKLWQELLCNIKYFDVRLTAWQYTEERKQVLRNRICDYQEREWLKWEDKQHRLDVIISFKSLVV